MTPSVEFAIRTVVFLVMVTVGLDLRARDFLRVRKYPSLVVGVAIGQWIALVSIAGLVGRWLALPDGARAGVLLIAASPAAALSCFYAHLARGQLALATTVTAFSTVLAAFATPLVAEFGFRVFLDSHHPFDVAPAALVQQMLAGLVFPLLVGMLAAHRFADRVDGWQRSIRTVGVIVSLCLIVVIVVGEFAAITAAFAAFFLGAATFTLAMLAVGFLVAAFTTSGGSYRRALPWAFPARNIAVAVLMGMNVDGKATITAFTAVLFVTQLASLIPIALWMRRASSSRSRQA